MCRITTSDPSEIAGIDQDLLQDFVRIARSKRVSPVLALGGWTGSRFFSTIVATAESRTKFIKAILALVDKYDLDGIDFDWEYPGHQGLGCNAVDPDDSANFLSLLQELRKNRSNLELSAAVATPFTGPDGNPMTDVSEFANVLDRVELMVYDTWSSKTNVGPNAPLRDDCAPSDFQFGSVHSIVDQWTQAKFPIEKLVLGLAAYGHSFTVSPSSAFNGSTRSLNTYPSIGGPQPAGSSDTPGDTSKDPCGNPYGLSGVFTFSGLVNTGFLDERGNAKYNYAIDGCSGTPFLYDEKSQVMVSYDDAKSFGLKGAYIADNNLAGFAVWDATGDYNDILLDSLHSAIGISACD
ncbi:glycoside hydrolase family 18 protein [Favolaschia claudopus]|uniref:Glycoside hydrolase family 18 protein n=1 Tax=Favolaschia claudopus TaxID=2862362 RepID=A0AAW0CBP4_9AGAR